MRIEDFPAYHFVIILEQIKMRPQDLEDLIRDVFYRDIGEIITPEMINKNISEILRRASQSPQ